MVMFLAVREAGSALLGLLQVDHRAHLTQNYLSVYACHGGLMMCLSTFKSVLNHRGPPHYLSCWTVG